MPFEPPMANGEDSDMNMFLGVDMVDEDMGEDNMTDLILGDMFGDANMWVPGSPGRRQDDDVSRDGSPQRQQHVGQNNNHGNDSTAVSVIRYKHPLQLYPNTSILSRGNVSLDLTGW